MHSGLKYEKNHFRLNFDIQCNHVIFIHIEQLCYVTPRDHFDFMLNNYKVQPDSNLYKFKDIKKCHMWKFQYKDAEMKIDSETGERYLELPYQTNDFLVKPGDNGWSERVIRLHPEYDNTDRFEYEKLSYYVNKK